MADHDGELCVYAAADPMTGEPLNTGAEGEVIPQGPTHMVGCATDQRPAGGDSGRLIVSDEGM